MISLRIGLALLLAMGSTSTLAGNGVPQILAVHPLWVSERLKWQQDPGDNNQSWTAGGVLYFGEQHEFGRFNGVLIKRGKRLALSEGEGEIVYAGTWSVKDEIVEVEYRLVGMYKVISQLGNKAPEIPGPVQHAEMRLDPESPMHLEFDGVGFQASSHLKASDSKERLRIYAAKLKQKDPAN